MNTWILIILFSGSAMTASGAYVGSVEFNSRSSCMVAQDQIKKQAIAYCVQK